MGDAAPQVRLDVWLWAARFFRTRSLTKQAITGGRVRVNGSAGKSGKSVKPGDRLQVTRGEARFEIEVLALSDKRGSASIAQTLYRESEASRAEREVRREQARALAMSHARPPSRPDKQARRQLRELKKQH